MKRRAAIFAGQATAMAVAAAAIYWPALQGTWLSDDTLEIVGNRDLRTWAGLRRIWAGQGGPDYFPLKSTVQWLEWHCWGAQPFGYHCVTLALHVCAALLFCRVLRRLGVRQAWIGGWLFLVHPLFVESVAWISELKNTLSLALLLLAFDAYLEFDPGGRRRGYVASLGWFVAAALAKTSVVLFPALLVVKGWWQRGRVRRADLLAALPFALVSVVLGSITLVFQQHRAIEGVTLVPGGLATRFAAAGLAACFYLGKLLVPTGLSFVYPRWPLNPPALWTFAPWFAGAAAAGWLWRAGRGAGRPPNWARHAAFGLGWFALNLIPVGGVFPMAYQRFSWVADHFVYLPALGILGLAAAALGAWADASGTRRPSALAAAAVLCGAFALAARAHAGAFRDETTLWTRTLAENPRCAAAYNNLGIAADAGGDRARAIADFRTAVHLAPDYPEAFNNLGGALLKQGEPDEAVPEFEAALRLDPSYALPHNNLGGALQAEGRYGEAAAEYRAALRLDPASADAAYNLGLCLAMLDRPDGAIAAYERALRVDPGLYQAENNLGVTLAHLGRLDEAMAHYRRALRLHPAYPDAEDNLGLALAKSGRVREAAEHFRAALALDPENANARHNLAVALRALGAD